MKRASLHRTAAVVVSRYFQRMTCSYGDVAPCAPEMQNTSNYEHACVTFIITGHNDWDVLFTDTFVNTNSTSTGKNWLWYIYIYSWNKPSPAHQKRWNTYISNDFFAIRRVSIALIFILKIKFKASHRSDNPRKFCPGKRWKERVNRIRPLYEGI
jgi:hypothetical protein